MKRIKALATILAVGLGIFFLSKNIKEFSQIFGSIDYKYLIGGCSLAAIASIISAFKLSKTFEYALGLRIDFLEWLNVYVKSYLLNNIVPLLGVAYRGSHLKKKFNLGYTDYIAATYVFALVGLLVLLLLASFFLAIHDEKYFYFVIFIAIIFLVVIKLIFFKFLGNLEFKSKRLNFYLSKLTIFGNLVAAIKNQKKLFNYLALFLFGAFIDFLVYLFTFYSFKQAIALDSLIYIYLAYSLSWILRVTPGNIGLQEVLIMSASTYVGFGGLSGVFLSIALRFVNFVGALALWGGVQLCVVLKQK